MSGSGTGTAISAGPSTGGSSNLFVQAYCSVGEIISDLGMAGQTVKADLLGRIEAASDVIMRRGGNFIPVTETRYFDVESKRARDRLYIPALLELVSLKIDDEAVSSDDYRLNPANRLWKHGPYISIDCDDLWADENGNEIEGRWGLFDQTINLGVSATQTDSETTLAVANGALISPGMTLLVEDELEYVTAGNGGPGSPAATSATSALNGDVTSQDATITVDDGSEFHEGEVIQVGVEDMVITKIGGDELAVTRGWNETIPADHDDDTAIRVYRTFKVERGVNGTTAAAHSGKTIYRQAAPSSVNYLCRQIAALMKEKSETHFTGSSGNAENGSGKFYSEFPPNQMAEVLGKFNTGD